MQRLTCLALFLIMGIALAQEIELEPFHSDGCSIFPDSDLFTQTDWCDCCIDHDIAYWRGGTEQERAAADETLQSCVLQETNNSFLAQVMFEGVRLGGSPYFYNWYRWGYGWPYGRGYTPLTEAEAERANALINEWFVSGKRATCSALPLNFENLNFE